MMCRQLHSLVITTHVIQTARHTKIYDIWDNAMARYKLNVSEHLMLPHDRTEDLTMTHSPHKLDRRPSRKRQHKYSKYLRRRISDAVRHKECPSPMIVKRTPSTPSTHSDRHQPQPPHPNHSYAAELSASKNASKRL